MDFSGYTLQQLIELQKTLPSVIDQRKRESQKSLIAELQATAAAAGFSLEELLSVGKPAVGRKGSPAKYLNPANIVQTWTGRGRKPQWIIDGLAAGKSLTDFEV